MSVIAWETGELELDAGRVVDSWSIAKHDEVDADDRLEDVHAELVVLVRDEALPPGAFARLPDATWTRAVVDGFAICGATRRQRAVSA